MLPYNEELEDSVLGCMLMDATDHDNMFSLLSMDHFYLDHSREIFGVALELYTKGSPIDLVTVGTALKKQERSDLISKMSSLTTNVASAVNVSRYCFLLSEVAMKRDLVRSCMDVIRDEDPDKDIFRTYDKMSALLTASVDKYVPTTEKSLGDLKSELVKRILNFRETGKIDHGVKTGLQNLDFILTMLGNSEMITLGALPGHGKTALCLAICYNLSVIERVPSLYISLEMPKRGFQPDYKYGDRYFLFKDAELGSYGG